MDKQENYQHQADMTLNKFTDYMSVNRLILNQDKTQLIMISQHPDIRKQVIIKTEKKVSNFKYL